jgi:hypothetical protein
MAYEFSLKTSVERGRYFHYKKIDSKSQNFSRAKEILIFHLSSFFCNQPMQRPSKSVFFAEAWNNILRYVVDGVQNVNITIADRQIIFNVRGRFHSIREPLVWDGYALDIRSGISAKMKHFKSMNGAMEHTLRELCNRLVAAGILAP